MRETSSSSAAIAGSSMAMVADAASSPRSLPAGAAVVAASNGVYGAAGREEADGSSPVAGGLVSSSGSGSSGSECQSSSSAYLSKTQSVDQEVPSAVVAVTAPASGEQLSESALSEQLKTAAAAAAKRTPNDFIFERVLGEGSFSTVYLARDIHTSKQYAIKVCEKLHIKREKKEMSIKREKEIMQLIGLYPNPFFVKLFCTFHDHSRLYFVMTYAKNGEILPYIHKVGCFDAECTKFYGGEVVLALEYLHKLGIIHRDLKPENILLDERMHILITDFGSAKMEADQERSTEGAAAVAGAGDEEAPGMRPRKNSFVGTADYVSPELLTNKPAKKSVDLWALGCLIYQLLAGLPPFRAPNEYLIFQRIVKLEYSFPDGFNPTAKDLVHKLLEKDGSKRLGCDEMGGYGPLKAHPFFEGLDWENLHTVKPPPITPYLPASGSNEELRSDFAVSPNIRPGFDDQQLSRLLDMHLREGLPKSSDTKAMTAPGAPPSGSILDISPEAYAERLAAQAKSSPWHPFVDNHLILKQGFIDKRKGLFARRRMFLLTTGPHFYYVDPVNMILKGEIPWSSGMRPEPKNFKTFFVHTPNRTYYLEDPQGYALEWCRVLEEVRDISDRRRPDLAEGSPCQQRD
ncbi:3-phosphoinositide-dependent protein kinase 1 [Hypsibius exemplaris]|uniref:3-phosphoinositide-dependent protein kinase 1 n=1 Tax=Hypsibius exemplaris TaxID=2072580 RepID=A0A1W0X109_HYPEX|nr:3-phosphoinositide-dependent protein kinase 1 [Hypsibius exemplaris]